MESFMNQQNYDIWDRGIIVSYIFEDEASNAVTVNGICYGKMLKDFFFVNETKSLNLNDMWFQQNGVIY